MWLFRKKVDKNDEELVLDYFKSGNKTAVGLLFEKHVTTIYGVCLFYFRERERAEDAVMQIFEKLLIELRNAEIKNFKAWLSFVVRNYCISELRKNKGHYFLPETYLDFEVNEVSYEEEERIGKIDDDMMLDFMKESIHILKEHQRICITLFYLNNLSYDDIVNKTGYSMNEVKSYIQNGKRKLKITIEQKISEKGNESRK